MDLKRAIELYKKDYDRPVVGYWQDGSDIILNVKPRIPDEPAQWLVNDKGQVYNTNPLRNPIIASNPMKKI